MTFNRLLLLRIRTVLGRCGLLLLGAVLLAVARPALADGADGTIVRLHTTQGPIDLRLLDAQAPRTVANFLAYVNAGDYRDVFFHRSVRNFIVQAGGFRWAQADASCCQSVTSRGQIQNEFSATRSNVRGTVAMAKVGSNPDSATSQWFINLGNNAANLDVQNGGFTVFARVTAPSLVVVDRIAALPIVNAGGVYGELPLANWTPGTVIQQSQLVRIERASVLPPRSGRSDADRVFDYLEAAFPEYLFQASGTPGTPGSADGYAYRHYSGSNAYVGVKDSRVWYLVPAIDDRINLLGPLADWLGTAQAAGY